MKRLHVIQFRANEPEYAALQALAAQQARNMSEVLRDLIREAAKEHGVWEPALELAREEGEE